MKTAPQFLLRAALIGVLLPFFIALCVFGTTLQSFVSPQPTAGYWSGAATPQPTAVPSPVRVWGATALSSASGGVFVLWSLLGALAGEGLAVWRWGREWDASRRAWLGALAGSVTFIAVALCGFMR